MIEVNRYKTEKLLELGEIDIDGLKTAVLNLPESEWDTEADYRVNYNKRGAIRQAQHIIFRFSNKQKIPVEYSNLSCWGKWKNILLPVMQKAVKNYSYKNGVFPRIMLAKLPPSCFIAPHTDGDYTGHIPHKIHIPLFTNEQSFFFFGNERFHFREGFAYEVNNGLKHSAVNGGTTDRIHLIFEYLDADIQPEPMKKQLLSLE